MRHRKDGIDLMCEEWAVTRRKVLGIILPSNLEPRERLGKLRSTLAAVKTDAEGASHRTTVTEEGHYPQAFPEVYVGLALTVHQCYCTMIGEYRLVMDAHYVWRELSVKDKLPVIGLAERRYFECLTRLKSFIDGYVKASRVIIPRTEKGAIPEF